MYKVAMMKLAISDDLVNRAYYLRSLEEKYARGHSPGVAEKYEQKSNRFLNLKEDRSTRLASGRQEHFNSPKGRHRVLTRDARAANRATRTALVHQPSPSPGSNRNLMIGGGAALATIGASALLARHIRNKRKQAA